MPFSPPYFFAFALNDDTDPLQLAPAFFTLPGLLLPFFLPSAKFSRPSCLTFLRSSPGLTSFVVFCFVMIPTPAASSFTSTDPCLPSFAGLPSFKIFAQVVILIAQFFTWLSVSSSSLISSIPCAFDSTLQLGGIVKPRLAAKL